MLLICPAGNRLYGGMNRIDQLSHYLSRGIGLDPEVHVEAERQIPSLPPGPAETLSIRAAPSIWPACSLCCSG